MAWGQEWPSNCLILFTFLCSWMSHWRDQILHTESPHRFQSFLIFLPLFKEPLSEVKDISFPALFSFINWCEVAMDSAGVWGVVRRRPRNGFFLKKSHLKSNFVLSGLGGSKTIQDIEATHLFWAFPLGVGALGTLGDWLKVNDSLEVVPESSTSLWFLLSLTSQSAPSQREGGTCYNNIPVTTRGSGPLWSWEGRISH